MGNLLYAIIEGSLPCLKDWLTRAARRADSSCLNVFAITLLMKSSHELFLLSIEIMGSEIFVSVTSIKNMD